MDGLLLSEHFSHSPAKQSYVQGLEAYSELIARLFEERFPTGGKAALTALLVEVDWVYRASVEAKQGRKAADPRASRNCVERAHRGSGALAIGQSLHSGGR